MPFCPNKEVPGALVAEVGTIWPNGEDVFAPGGPTAAWPNLKVLCGWPKVVDAPICWPKTDGVDVAACLNTEVPAGCPKVGAPDVSEAPPNNEGVLAGADAVAVPPNNDGVLAAADVVAAPPNKDGVLVAAAALGAPPNTTGMPELGKAVCPNANCGDTTAAVVVICPNFGVPDARVVVAVWGTPNTGVTGCTPKACGTEEGVVVAGWSDTGAATSPDVVFPVGWAKEGVLDAWLTMGDANNVAAEPNVKCDDAAEAADIAVWPNTDWAGAFPAPAANTVDDPRPKTAVVVVAAAWPGS